jgi:hypothetical protein
LFTANARSLHAVAIHNYPMDRLSLIVLVACGVFAYLLATRRKLPRPPPRTPGPVSSKVLRVDLGDLADRSNPDD